MNTSKQVSIVRYKNNEMFQDMDDILKEYILSIYLEEHLVVKLICIPEYLEELVIGYLYSESMISSLEDIISIRVNMDCGRADVTLGNERKPGKSQVTMDSGDFTELPYRFAAPQRVERLEDLIWEPEIIMKNSSLLLGKSELFRKTGNVHSVMICQDDQILYFSEDIGRYNAFDKSLGRALKDKVDLNKTCVYTSGRIPSSIALKAIRAGIPMIVSRSAPTDTTLEIAKQYNLTVVGFARGDKMNLYVK